MSKYIGTSQQVTLRTKRKGTEIVITTELPDGAPIGVQVSVSEGKVDAADTVIGNVETRVGRYEPAALVQRGLLTDAELQTLNDLLKRVADALGDELFA
ncbi:MAG: hypothetical protein VW338_03490 [Rhodospirillaceae bacterium]